MPEINSFSYQEAGKCRILKLNIGKTTDLKGGSMDTYIILCKFTQKGIENVKDSPARLDAAKQAFKAVGGELKAFYLTMGQYDMVVIGELPDAESGVKISLAIGSKGAVRMETLRAFPEADYRKIIESLP